ncbi:MAG: glycosyltransferase [Pseudomonadota bacterium]
MQEKVEELDIVMAKSLQRESDLTEALNVKDINLQKTLKRESDLAKKLNDVKNTLISTAKDLLFYRGLYKTTPLSAHKRSFKKMLFRLDRFFETRTYIPESILLNPYVFDPLYYQRTHPHLNDNSKEVVKHWLEKGVFKGLPSSQFFHVKYYLNVNKDLQKYFGKDYQGAIQHWVDFGIKEQRIASPSRERINTSSNYDHNIEYLLSDLKQEKNLYINKKNVNQSSNNTSQKNLVIFIAGESMKKPGYKYRVERYAQAVKRLNYQVICISIDEVAKRLNDCKRAKLILIWRAAWSSEVAKLFNLTEQLNIPTVFDIDDLMVRPELATSDIIDAIRYDNKDESAVKKLYSNVAKTMKSCNYNTAATHELAWHMRKVGPKKPIFVLPNGYSSKTYSLSRLYARIKEKSGDGLIRIGYASGGLTHQKDFEQCANAVAQILSDNENVRLVLFKDDRRVSLDISEFPSLKNVQHKIEWRPFAAHDLLPKEVARFDVNIAPLEYGNEFCESKSELKYFEAAIANVPTIASPTGPFKRAIKHKQTGFLASNVNEWLEYLKALVLDSNYRKEIGRMAHRHVLWPFGPSRRVELAYSLLEQTKGKRNSARSFYYSESEYFREIPSISIEKYEIVFETDKNKESRVTVIIPLFNYEGYVAEALESVKSQTMPDIDLIVVDDKSTDGSQEIVHKWMISNKERFNRLMLVQHKQNQGLGASRNTAFDLSDTLYIMALDADNTLLSECCEECFNIIESESAAFAYSIIEQFGDSKKLMGNRTFNPADFIPNSGIDAMAMISKEAWSLVGGYTTHRMGWQDYDFWCRIVDRGLYGVHVPKTLAKYRVHQKSMLRTSTDKVNNKLELIDWMESEHSWLSLTTPERTGHHVTSKLSD